MYQRISGIAFAAALLAGCSGDLGGPTPVDSDDGAASGTDDGMGASAGGSEAEVVRSTINDDGTITIERADGSTETLDGEGNVIDSTPATDDGPGVGGDGPTDDGVGVGGSDDGVGDGAGLGETDVQVPEGVPAAECTPGTPEGTQIPRLTNRQYDNTVEALIGVNLGLTASTLQADSKGNMDARSWDSYQTAAATIASTIITDATARANVISCTTADAACASDIISNFGAKVFRRPLTADEVAHYEALFNDTALTESGTFDDQIQLVLEAMFQSPYFLTLAEFYEGGPSTDADGSERFALDDYELASRLSYMLWDSMPDQALFDAAAAGSLTGGTGITEQATRMLQDDRAKGLVQRLHMNYMRMGQNTRWVGYERDAAKYPHYSPTQIDAIAQETVAVAENVVFSGGTFSDLMTTTVGYVNADTAPLYGLDPSAYGANLTEVDLGAERPGILTRAGWLAANAYGNRTSPIHRGAFIMKDVLCMPMGNPDPEAALTPLPTDDGLVTNRERTAAQTSIAPDCVACHETLINPPGFALEGFDAAGGVQTMDNGVAIDTTAKVVVGSQQVDVSGAADLMAAIGASPQAMRCYTENWVTIAYNRVLSGEDVCTVDDIAGKMAADPTYTVTNLITDLATVESFRYRAHETEVAQ